MPRAVAIVDNHLLQLLALRLRREVPSLSQQPLDTVTTSEVSLDTLTQELAAIQQTGSKRIALLGSRHVPLMHQQLIEMMSYALVLGGNRLVTSGAIGTNSAAIKGAMRADSNLLTVILPQSLSRQPRESKKQLAKVVHLIENSSNDHLSLGEASAMCNSEIISRCQQLICFAFHDSHTLLKTCQEAEDQRKIVTLFYFD